MSIGHAVETFRNQPAQAMIVPPSPALEVLKQTAKNVVHQAGGVAQVAKDVAAIAVLGPVGAAACISCPTWDIWDKFSRANPGPDMVDKTLECGDLKKFTHDINDLTKNELQETCDYIVKKMTTASDPCDRKLLQDMHNSVRAEEKSRQWNFDFKWPKDFDPKWILA